MRITKFVALLSLLAGSAIANEGTVHEAVDVAAMKEAGTVQYDLGGGGNGACCNNYCYDDGCGRRGGIVAGGEVTFLQVYSQTAATVTIPGPDFAGNIPFNFGDEEGYRVWLGWESANGLGARVTYWDFDDEATLGPGPLAAVVTGLANGFDVWTLDIEATQRATFCGWDLLGSMGVRIAEVEDFLAAGLGGDEGIALVRNFEGAGLTFALYGDHRIGHSGLSIYGQGRTSILFGDSNQSIFATPGVAFLGDAGPDVDDTVAVWELALGLKYSRDTQFGGLFVRAGVEAQRWELTDGAFNLGFGGNTATLDDVVSLFGYTFAAGINY